MTYKCALVFCILCLSQFSQSEEENQEIRKVESKEMEENERIEDVIANNESVKTTGDMEGFIVGGALTSSERNPHAAYLAITCKMPDKSHHFGCGSSIINQVILLTAAHCLQSCKAKGTFIGITVGNEHKFKGQNHTVSRYVVHPYFVLETLINDIAVVFSKTKLTLGLKVKRALIAKVPPRITLGHVAGWGLVNEKESISTVYLKETIQEVLSRQECLSVLKTIPPGTFCAKGTHKIGKFGYASRGDSGSGLIGDDFILRGIVSYKNIKLAVAVIVYTDVPYFFDWIRVTTEQIFCNPKG